MKSSQVHSYVSSYIDTLHSLSSFRHLADDGHFIESLTAGIEQSADMATHHTCRLASGVINKACGDVIGSIDHLVRMTMDMHKGDSLLRLILRDCSYEAKSMSRRGLETFIDGVFESVIKKAKSETGDIDDDSAIDDDIFLRGVGVARFLRLVGIKQLNLTRNENIELIVNVHTTLEERIPIRFYGTQDDLKKLTLKDLRARLSGILKHSFIFIPKILSSPFPLETDLIFKSNFETYVTIPTSRFVPDLSLGGNDVFMSLYSKLPKESILTLTIFYHDESEHVSYSTLKIFGYDILVEQSHRHLCDTVALPIDSNLGLALLVYMAANVNKKKNQGHILIKIVDLIQIGPSHRQTRDDLLSFKINIDQTPQSMSMGDYDSLINITDMSDGDTLARPSIITIADSYEVRQTSQVIPHAKLRLNLYADTIHDRRSSVAYDKVVHRRVASRCRIECQSIDHDSDIERLMTDRLEVDELVVYEIKVPVNKD